MFIYCYYFYNILGFVCNRKDLSASGCCHSGGESTRRYECTDCQSNNCCSIYEHCVSCCLSPANVSSKKWFTEYKSYMQIKGAFLWDNPDQGQWSVITRIMVDQMNQWIHSGQGFIGSFDLPWSKLSQNTDNDGEHLKGTDPRTSITVSHAIYFSQGNDILLDLSSLFFYRKTYWNRF